MTGELSAIPEAPYRSLRPAAVAATITLALVGVESLIVAGLRVYLSAGFPAGADGPQPTATRFAVESFLFQWQEGVALVLVSLAGIAFVIWLVRARTNLDGNGEERLEWRRDWAVGAWIVPLANLVLPQLVVLEVDRVSERRAAEAEGRPIRRHRAVPVTWVVLWSLYLVATQVDNLVLDELDYGRAVLLLGAMIGILAAVAAGSAILLVRCVTALQERFRPR